MRSAIALVTLTMLLVGCGQEQPGKPVIRTEIGGGEAKAEPRAPARKTRKSDCRSVSFEGTALTHCVADPARHRVAMALGPDGGAPWRSLAQFAAHRGADAPSVAFAMNGGMFDGEGKPIGYYVEKGERLKTLNRNDGPGNFHLKPNGVFYGSGGTWRVRTADDFYANVGTRPEFGTQSGPMLLIDGKLHPEISEDGPSRTVRNAVGVDSKGRAHFVISEGPLSFGKLARYYRDVVKAKEALFLDGTVSALWNPARDRLDSGAPIGPIIVVENREDAS